MTIINQKKDIVMKTNTILKKMTLALAISTSLNTTFAMEPTSYDNTNIVSQNLITNNISQNKPTFLSRVQIDCPFVSQLDPDLFHQVFYMAHNKRIEQKREEIRELQLALRQALQCQTEKETLMSDIYLNQQEMLRIGIGTEASQVAQHERKRQGILSVISSFGEASDAEER